MKNIIKIEEMLDGIHESETLNAADGSELLSNKLSEEEKGRILNMALNKMKDERDNPAIKIQRRKRRGIIIAALIAVFAFATTAFAAEVFDWDVRISNYLGINENNSAQLAESGMNIDVTTENKGIKIDAVQTLGDANNIYILFDVTAPEGTILSPEARFEMVYLKVDGVTNMGYSCDFLPDESKNDNKGTMLLSMDANKSINDKTLEVRFKDLVHYNQESGDYITDVKGEWKLAWKLNYKDNSTKYPVDQKLTVNGKTVNVDSVSISPIALNVKVSGSYIKEYDSAPPAPGADELIKIKAVTLSDGTVLTQDDSLGWGSSTEGNDYMINMKMKKLLVPKQIESITLNDTVIPLNQ